MKIVQSCEEKPTLSILNIPVGSPFLYAGGCYLRTEAVAGVELAVRLADGKMFPASSFSNCGASILENAKFVTGLK